MSSCRARSSVPPSRESVKANEQRTRRRTDDLVGAHRASRERIDIRRPLRFGRVDRAVELGHGHVRRVEKVGALEIRAPEVGALHSGTTEVQVRQDRSAEIGPDEDRILKSTTDPPKVDSGEVRLAELCPSEVRPIELSVCEDRRRR